MLLLIGFWLKNYTILFKKDKNQWFLLIFCIFLLKLTINFSKLFNFLLFAQLKPYKIKNSYKKQQKQFDLFVTVT